MKKLLGAVILAACTSAQADEPKWLKDVEVVHCVEGECRNLTTNTPLEDPYKAPDGYSVVFPHYTVKQVQEIAPEVVEYYKTNSLGVVAE